MRRSRRHAYIALLGLFVLLCAGCKTVLQPAQANSFILSLPGGVAFLHWTVQSGQITGNYTVTTAQGTQSLTVTGQQLDADHVILHIMGTGILSGTIVNTTTPTMQTTGADGNLTWYTGSSQQYGQIQATYRVYEKVQTDLTTLREVEETPPDDSASSFYQSSLAQARSRVNDEQTLLTSSFCRVVPHAVHTVP